MSRVTIDVTVAPTPLTATPRVEVRVECESHYRETATKLATEMATSIVETLRPPRSRP